MATKASGMIFTIFRHEIYGVQVNKILLRPFESKRCISKNGIDSFAYRHRLTDKEWDEYAMELWEAEQRQEAQTTTPHVEGLV